MEDLGLGQIFKDICDYPRGIVLVTDQQVRVNQLRLQRCSIILTKTAMTIF